MKKVQEKSLAETAYLRLRKEIHMGVLVPGGVVSERELASRYEMSKTPIREAVTQVCREGLLQRLPGRGYMVSPITIKEIQDLFDLRLILEVAVIEKLFSNPASEYLPKLKEIADIRYVLEDPESHFVFLEANRTFHLTLARSAGNVRVTQVLESLLIEMERLFHLGLRIGDSSEEMAKEHQDLIAALEANDLNTARESTIQQILESKKRVMDAIMTGDLKTIHAI